MNSKSKQELQREIEALQEQLAESKRTLQEAQEQVRWLARFPEENPNPVVRVSAEGNILYRNAAAAEWSGWPWEVGEAVAGSLSAMIKQAMAEVREYRQDLEMGGRFYSVSLVPFPDDGYVNIYGIDITERRRAEEETRNRAAQQQATFEALNDAVLIYDTGMTVQRVNPSFIMEYGFNPVGLHLTDIIARVSCRHLDGRPLVLADQPTPLALRGKKVTGAHFLVTRPDGSDAVVETSSGPIAVEDRVIGSVTVWHDITKSKWAEEALRESELFLRETQRIARLGGWMANPLTDYLKWTDGVYEIIAAPRDYTPGLEEGLKFFLPQYIPTLKRHLEDCLTKGEAFALECQVRTTEGKTLWTEVRGLAITVKGEQACVLGTFQDITEYKRAEEALRDNEARFKLLSETAGRLLASKNPQEIVNELCRAVMEHLDCHTCFHHLVDEESGRLHLSACSGLPQEEACRSEWLEYGVTVVGNVARDGVQMVIEDLLNTPDPRVERIRSYGIQAYACHPLIAGSRVLGTLSFGTRSRPRFSSQDLALMKTVADQVATAMERKRLLSELNKSREELERRVRERTGELLIANLALQEQASLLDLAHDAIMVRDLRDKIVYWNRGAENTYGWPRDEALGKASHDFLQTRSANSLHEIRSCLLGDGKWEGELQHVTHSGSPIIVESRQALQRNLDGEPTGILEINRGITKRKEAEAQLRQASQYSRSLIEASLDPLVTISPEGKITDTNEATIKVTGVPREKLIGSDFSNYFTEPEKATEGYRQVFDKGFVTDYPLTIRHQDGSLTEVLYNASVYKDPLGNVLGVFAAARDITEHKRAEEKVRQAKILLQSVFDGISEPLMMVEKDLRVRVLNQAALRYFRIRTAVEAIGRTCYHLTDGRCRQCDRCAINLAIAEGKTIDFERRGLFDPDLIEQVTVYPIDEAEGGIAGAIIRIGDITETRKLEQHMMRVDRLSSLGQLSAGIAHEIRNPLAGINLFVDVLSDEEKFQRTKQELDILGEIKSNIKKMDGIIKRVLDFARQSEGPILDKLDVRLLIDETLKLWRAPITKAGIMLHLSVADNLPSLRGDAIELQQVLNNLLENAIDAMRQGGSLTLTARPGAFSLDENRRAVIITIQDTGPGIPVEHRGNIFNPFFTTKPAGTGLGLAISHRIVSRHGGTIFCDSTTDSGATFRLEFPIASGE